MKQNIIDRFFNVFDVVSKTRTLNVLERLPERQLRDLGIDSRLLAAGVRGWPWSMPEDEWVSQESEFKHSVAAPIGKVSLDSEPAEDVAQNAA